MDVYRLAERLSDMIWHDYDAWSQKVQRTMGYQAIDAVDSIAANIAEGYGRFHIAERKLFYRYAFIRATKAPVSSFKDQVSQA